jgi:DNA-binding NarL/FixJ family response regulator
MKAMNPSRGSIRILAVDDHHIFRETLALFLATQPDMNLVAEASNGREAIQQFRQNRPDITLMDLQMPEMNGLDAMVAIRKEFPKAKIILMTTYNEIDVEDAMRLGARAYLLKTQLYKQLVGIIRAVQAAK